jgi:hypothetical protein
VQVAQVRKTLFGVVGDEKPTNFGWCGAWVGEQLLFIDPFDLLNKRKYSK